MKDGIERYIQKRGSGEGALDGDGDDGDGGDADDVGEGDAKPRSRRLKRDGGVSVELDLALGAHANAREHFDRKKKHDAKHGKTLAQNKRAVAAAEKKLSLIHI